MPFRKVNQWGATKPAPGYGVDWGDQINAGLRGLWLLGEGGGNKASDLAGRSPGTLTNAPTWVQGKFGTCLNFAKASDQYVNLGNTSAVNITGNLSISIWINPASTPSAIGHNIFSKDKDSGGRSWDVDYNNSGGITALRFYINGGAGAVSYTHLTLPTNREV